MTWYAVLGWILGTLGALAMLRWLITRLAVWVLSTASARYKLCEVCYKARGNWLFTVRSSEHAPFRMCRPCIEKKWSQGYAAIMYERGSLVEDKSCQP